MSRFVLICSCSLCLPHLCNALSVILPRCLLAHLDWEAQVRIAADVGLRLPTQARISCRAFPYWVRHAPPATEEATHFRTCPSFPIPPPPAGPTRAAVSRHVAYLVLTNRIPYINRETPRFVHVFRRHCKTFISFHSYCPSFHFSGYVFPYGDLLALIPRLSSS